MKTKTLTIPELMFVVGTRAALSAGVALLLGDKLDRRTRVAVGRTLVALGIVTTLPAVIALRGKRPFSAVGRAMRADTVGSPKSVTSPPVP